MLKLAVQHAPIGDDHDGVKDSSVLGVVQSRELVGQPGDGEALPAPGRVLDEVMLPSSVLAGVGHQSPHCVELMVAREDQEALTSLIAPVVQTLDLVDELAQQVQHTVPRPYLLP